MTWDLDGKEAARENSQLLMLQTKSPKLVLDTIRYALDILQSIAERESLTKAGWVRHSNLVNRLNKLIIPQ
mgnify:FL=1